MVASKPTNFAECSHTTLIWGVCALASCRSCDLRTTDTTLRALSFASLGIHLTRFSVINKRRCNQANHLVDTDSAAAISSARGKARGSRAVQLTQIKPIRCSPMQLLVGQTTWGQTRGAASSQSHCVEHASSVGSRIDSKLKLQQSKLTNGHLPTCGGTSSAGRHAVSLRVPPVREFAEQCGCIDEAEERLLDSDRR